MWSELVWCIAAVCVAASQHASRLVHLEQGPVRGRQDPVTGVFVFSSIPYATAPTGSHRFQAPLPPPKWVEPLETDKQIVCPQVDTFLKNKVMQEDCLIANVYVPNTEEKNLPVIVYIHGGAFQVGYGNVIPPKNFVKGRYLIAVTFNYRLGILGFLCLGTESTPGNAGLKDQVALLRWVKRNIAKFGGSPDDVTISGGSAGSASVEFLMLSKTTTGLFNKVILESGASTGGFAMQVNPVEIAKYYAGALGLKDVEDIYDVEEFLKTVPFKDFFKDAFRVKNKNSTFSFVPCLERETGNEMIIGEAPVNIIKRGDYRKVPMLFGFTNMEGLLEINRFDAWKADMNENFTNFLPSDLQFASDVEKKQVAKKIKEFYFGIEEITDQSVLKYVDYFSDVVIIFSTLRSVDLYVESGHDQIYLYEFSFVDEDTPVVPHTNVRGAKHCAQTITVLDARQILNPLDVHVTEEYKKIRHIVQNYWYNFIRFGKPVPEASILPAWPAVGQGRTPHMSLAEKVELKDKLHEQRYLFWKDIYSRYYRTPQPPPPPEPRTVVRI